MSPAPSQPDELLRAEELLHHFELLEAQFQQVREGLTHSHRLATLGTIASITAHEYNNILTPVISYAQLALAKPDDHDLMRKAVERALAGAQRAAHISSSLLGFARESDPTAPGVAKLRAVIDEAVACLARDPRKDGIDLTIDVPDVTLNISALNLQQVLLNLFLNARQAMRRRGGKLRVTAKLEGQLAHITVSDSGPGIPPEIFDRLFQPFVTLRPTPAAAPGSSAASGSNFGGGESGQGGEGGRAGESGRAVPARGLSENSQRRDAAATGNARGRDASSGGGGGGGGAAERKGTGLGLCICRDLIRHAGGDITADPPTEGQGATFHIKLPLEGASASFEST